MARALLGNRGCSSAGLSTARALRLDYVHAASQQAESAGERPAVRPARPRRHCRDRDRRGRAAALRPRLGPRVLLHAAPGRARHTDAGRGAVAAVADEPAAASRRRTEPVEPEVVPLRQLPALRAQHLGLGLRERAGPAAVLAVRRARPEGPGQGDVRAGGRGDGRPRLSAGAADVRPARGGAGVRAGRAGGDPHPAQPLLRRRHDSDPVRRRGALLHGARRRGRADSGLDTRRRLRRPGTGYEGEPAADLSRARHGARRLRPRRTA